MTPLQIVEGQWDFPGSDHECWFDIDSVLPNDITPSHLHQVSFWDSLLFPVCVPTGHRLNSKTLPDDQNFHLEMRCYESVDHSCDPHSCDPYGEASLANCPTPR